MGELFKGGLAGHSDFADSKWYKFIKIIER